MDITAGSLQRIELGIEHLINGGLISYYGVLFSMDRTKQPPELIVHSYSDAIQRENIRKDEAEEKIERSKEVLADLASKSVAFNNLLKTMPQRFCFCYDYGKGSILGPFKWGQVLKYKN